MSDWPYALRYGGQRTALARDLDRPAMVRAEAVVGRFRAPAMAVSFLTIGLQTAVNAAAVVGALIWATVYTTIGFVVLQSWLVEGAGDQ